MTDLAELLFVLRMFRRCRNGHCTQCQTANGTRDGDISPARCICGAKDRALLAMLRKHGSR